MFFVFCEFISCNFNFISQCNFISRNCDLYVLQWDSQNMTVCLISKCISQLAHNFQIPKISYFCMGLYTEFIYWYFDFISACDFISFNWDI